MQRVVMFAWSGCYEAEVNVSNCKLTCQKSQPFIRLMEEKSKHKGPQRALSILQTNRNRTERTASWASCCCSERKEQYVSSQLWSTFCYKLLDTRCFFCFFCFMCTSLGLKPVLKWNKQWCVEILQCSNRCQRSKEQNLHYHIITATHSVLTENCMRRIQRHAVMHC